MADEAIQDTIAKLLAKAKGTNNENEAAIFAAKAAELLTKHNLTEAQIRMRDSTADDPVELHMAKRNNVAKWRSEIADGCAQLYFCKLLFHKSKISFTGKTHNAEVCESMWNWLCSVVVRMAREYSPNKWEQEDFKRGAALRLKSRLNTLAREQYMQQRQNVQAAAATGTTLPALYDSEHKAIQDYLDNRFGTIRTKKSRDLEIRGGAGAAGYDKAGEISLHTQVAETRTSRMIGSS